MDYAVVKLIHQSAVALSITGFFVRGAASLAGARWVRGVAREDAAARRRHGAARFPPWRSRGCSRWRRRGTVAAREDRRPRRLRRSRRRRAASGAARAVRAAAWLARSRSSAWIVSVAMTKSPLGFLGAGARRVLSAQPLRAERPRADVRGAAGLTGIKAARARRADDSGMSTVLASPRTSARSSPRSSCAASTPPGPRYTSYPTADRFARASARRGGWRARASARCRRRGAAVAVRAHPVLRAALLLLRLQQDHHEAPRARARVPRRARGRARARRRFPRRRPPVSQLHFGGGSPTFLADDELAR
jgi:hypothetical protein